MLKRWSSKLSKDRKKENGVTNSTTNGVNGHNEASNGIASHDGTVTNGTSSGVHRNSTFTFLQQPQHEKVGDVERKDIDELFQEFAQLIHASKRPIPNQTGDGTYNGDSERPC